VRNASPPGVSFPTWACPVRGQEESKLSTQELPTYLTWLPAEIFASGPSCPAMFRGEMTRQWCQAGVTVAPGGCLAMSGDPGFYSEGGACHWH
jgi:hypothetical protein